MGVEGYMRAGFSIVLHSSSRNYISIYLVLATKLDMRDIINMFGLRGMRQRSVVA